MSDSSIEYTTSDYFETLINSGIGDESDWHFSCNQCGRRLDDEPCPDHAPVDVPGLRRVVCDKAGHPRMWFLDGDYYDPPCMYCVSAGQAERIAHYERCRHWAWRRMRIFRRAAGYARSLGIVTGYSTSWGGGNPGHRGCTHGFRWRGKRDYLLGWPSWKWRCLFRRHWPAEHVAFGLCTKCLPCPDCGATTGRNCCTCDNAVKP
jgi:hypothetical protein